MDSEMNWVISTQSQRRAWNGLCTYNCIYRVLLCRFHTHERERYERYGAYNCYRLMEYARGLCSCSWRALVSDPCEVRVCFTQCCLQNLNSLPVDLDCLNSCRHLSFLLLIQMEPQFWCNLVSPISSVWKRLLKGSPGMMCLFSKEDGNEKCDKDPLIQEITEIT